MQLRDDVGGEVSLVLRLWVLKHVAHEPLDVILGDPFPDEHHDVASRRRLMVDVLALDSETP